MEELGRRPHVGKMGIHCTPRREVCSHACHELPKARVSESFILQNHQKWGNQVTHSLHVTHFKVLPHKPNTNSQTTEFIQLFEVAHRCQVENTHVHMMFRNLSRLSGVKNQWLRSQRWTSFSMRCRFRPKLSSSSVCKTQNQIPQYERKHENSLQLCMLTKILMATEPHP